MPQAALLAPLRGNLSGVGASEDTAVQTLSGSVQVTRLPQDHYSVPVKRGPEHFQALTGHQGGMCVLLHGTCGHPEYVKAS